MPPPPPPPTNTYTQLTLLSAGPRATPRNATPFSLEGSHSLRPNLPFGAWMPQLQGSSTAPRVGLLDQDTGPQPKAGDHPPPNTHTLRGPDHGPRVWDEPVPPRVSGQSPARPLPPSLLPSPGCSRHSTPPPVPVPGEMGRRLRSPGHPRPARGKGALGPLGRRGRRGVGRSLRPRTPHTLGFGAGSPALLPLDSEPRPGGAAGRPESLGPGRLTPAGQWRSPLSALQSGRRRWIGSSPPTLTPGEGAERTAARVSLPGPSPRASPGPRLAAAARPHRPARLGSEPPRPSPEGRPLPRPLPPPGSPAAPSPPPRAPAAAAPPSEDPREEPRVSGRLRGLRGAARLPLRHGRRCPVSPLTSAILVPLGRTSSAEPSPRMGRLSQSQPPPPLPPPPRPARHPPGGRGGSAPYRAGRPATPPARSHTHAVRRSRGRRSCTRPPRARPRRSASGRSKVAVELREDGWVGGRARGSAGAEEGPRAGGGGATGGCGGLGGGGGLDRLPRSERVGDGKRASKWLMLDGRGRTDREHDDRPGTCRNGMSIGVHWRGLNCGSRHWPDRLWEIRTIQKKRQKNDTADMMGKLARFKDDVHKLCI